MPHPCDCPICSPLGGGEIARTGRGESLDGAWQKFARLDLDNRVDLGTCPDCNAIFEWTDHPQCYGSGNLDEEHLRRIEEPELGLVRELLRADEDPQAPSRVIVRAIAGGVAEDLLAGILRRMLYRQREVFRTLLPALLDALHLKPAFDRDLLSSYACWSHVRSREIVALIATDPRPRSIQVTHLLERCRKQLATPE